MCSYTYPYHIDRSQLNNSLELNPNLNDEHVLSSPLKVHPPLPLVDAQGLLLGANGVSSVQDDEDVGVGAGSEHVAREDFDLIWNNCEMGGNYMKWMK